MQSGLLQLACAHYIILIFGKKANKKSFFMGKIKIQLERKIAYAIIRVGKSVYYLERKVVL